MSTSTKKSPQPTQASCMLEYACFHNYGSVVEPLLKIFEEERLGNEARSRVKFYQFRNEVESFCYPYDDKLLSRFLGLENVYKTECAEAGISEHRWAECRHKILHAICLTLLGDFLSMPSFPQSLKDIKIPKDFNTKGYETDFSQVLEALAHEYSLDEESSSKAKRSFVSDVMSIKNRKKVLDEKKIFDLFGGFSLEELKESIKSLFADVELVVLGTPQLHVTYKKPTPTITSAVAQSAYDENWTEQEAQENGPYQAKSKKVNAPSTHKAQAVAAPARSSFTSPVVGVHAVQQPITPGRKHQEDVSVSQTVKDFQRKYAQQDPLETAVTSVLSSKKRKAAEADIDTPAVQSNVAVKRGNQPASPAKATSKDNVSHQKNKSIVAGRPSGAKIAFDEDDEIGEYDTNEEDDDVPLSKAIALINHARHAIDDTTKKIGLAQAKSHNETSRFSTGSSGFPAKPAKLENRNRALGARGRLRWSAAEKDALKIGIEKFGVGNWAEILADSSISCVFQNRTNVDLKDKYRTMIRNGEIDDAPRSASKFKKQKSQGSEDEDSNSE